MSMNINKLLEVAKDELVTSGKILPKCFVIQENKELAIIPMPFENHKKKVRVKQMLKQFITDKGSKEYYMVQEIWLSQPKEGVILTSAVRDVEREEGIMVARFMPDNAKMVISRFKRGDNEIIFDDVTPDLVDIGSNYWNIFGDEGAGIKLLKDAHNQKIIAKYMEEMRVKYKAEFIAARNNPEELKKVVAKMVAEVKRMKSDQDKQMLEDPDDNFEDDGMSLGGKP